MRPLFCKTFSQVELANVLSNANRITFGYYNLYQVPTVGQNLSIDVINIKNLNAFDFKKISVVVQEVYEIRIKEQVEPIAVVVDTNGDIFVVVKPRFGDTQKFGYLNQQSLKKGDLIEFLEISFDYAEQHFIRAEIFERMSVVTDSLLLGGSVYAIVIDDFQDDIILVNLM